MSFITIDFETYYSKEVGFSKHTTEEYINHPEFHVIGMGIKCDDDETQWVVGEDDIRELFSLIDWTDTAVLCHNAIFDATILSWRYGVRPAFIFDTLCMARAVHGVDAGGSLKALAERYALGEKGTEVVNALGKRLQDFAPDELARYGEYCKNDCDLTYALFNKLAQGFPQSEYDLIDMTIRMFTEPKLSLNDALLVERLEDVRNEKRGLLAGLMQELSCEDEEGVRAILASNKQFATLLERRGVAVPMKVSPTTGKEAPALAKNDEGFLALQEHEDPIVQQLCAVRLGTKSTIEESRIERFINVGARNKGLLPIPLKYYGAHTGRWSGSDGINMQNLPSRDKKKKALKNAIVAPDGYFIVNCDSSQIEARVLAWIAGQNDVEEQFRSGEDVYSTFASKIYRKPITKANPVERFVGKTCILGLGYGTGAEKLRHTLKTSPPGADLPLDVCKGYVDLYRDINYNIVNLWHECDHALDALMAGFTGVIHPGVTTCFEIDRQGIRLPNNLYIRYPKLRLNEEGRKIYDSRRGPVSIWGGAMVENIVQALARIIVGEQMLDIRERYPPVLTVHDAAVCLVPKDEIEEGLAYITNIMSTPPVWAMDLPVACEAKYGESYGEC
ncbi:MAG: DNA polymerase [Fluviibacter sp.]